MMRRVNTFEVRPLRQSDQVLLFELLDASAALWNELTYARRQAFFDNQDIWQVNPDDYRSRYKGVLGSATAQQVIRKNDEAWRSFFALLKQNENPSPPGYWKDGDERDLRMLIRNDQYTLQWGDRSRLEIPIGYELKEKYGFGYHERLRLEARGDPRWEGQSGRLEVYYDMDADAFRARQPVSDASLRRDDSLTTQPCDEGGVAALDIGANNLVAVTTSTGHQRRYHGRPSFQRFHSTTTCIADRQVRLEPEENSSKRIRSLYRKRTARRNHLQDALIRNLAEWLTELGVTEVIFGDLSNVLRGHWSTRVNEKTHQFWSHGRFRRRLREVLSDEYGIKIREVNEVDSSSTCPACKETHVSRSGDLFICQACSYDGHADVAASMNLLDNNTSVGSMARPVVSRENTTEKGRCTVPCLEWDDHRWQQRDHLTNEIPTNRSTTFNGKLVSSGSGST